MQSVAEVVSFVDPSGRGRGGAVKYTFEGAVNRDEVREVSCTRQTLANWRVKDSFYLLMLVIHASIHTPPLQCLQVFSKLRAVAETSSPPHVAFWVPTVAMEGACG